MKKRLANFLIRLILIADDKYKITLLNLLKSEEFLKRKTKYFERYSISPDFKINGKQTYFFGEGEIIIGSNNYIGDYSTIQAVKNCKVEIGKNCAISHNVKIYTSSYITSQNFDIEEELDVKSGNVIIGNGVWIGANVLINPNVKIGDNAVVGANSVVIKDIEKNTINSGIPAIKIKNKMIV